MSVQMLYTMQVIYFIQRLPPLKWAVNNLMEIARKLKCHRTREGALELEGSEVTIQMDKSKEEVRDLIPKQVCIQHYYCTRTQTIKYHHTNHYTT